MTKSFVGKTLRGDYDQTLRIDTRIYDPADKKLSQVENFICDDTEISIKFISSVCNTGCKQSDYKVVMTYQGVEIHCLAFVDKDGNIKIITHGKYDISINTTIYKDVLIDLRIFLKKYDGKYKYEPSGELLYFHKEVLTNGTKLEIHGSSILKSGCIKFSKW